MRDCRLQVFAARAHPRGVAGVAMPFAHDAEEPERIVRHVVHPAVGRSRGDRVVDGIGKDFRRAEDGQYRARLGMHVAEPDEPVALDAVPEIILAAEMDGAHSRVEYAVQALVRTPEFAEARHRPHKRNGAYALEVDFARGDEVKPHEAKASVADFDNAHERYVVHAVAYRVVVAGRLRPDVRHRLANALPEADAHLHAARAHAPDLEPAVQFAPEIQDHRSRLAVVLHRAAADAPPALFGNLPVARQQQALGVLHDRPVAVNGVAGRPHHPRRRQKRARARIGTALLQRI